MRTASRLLVISWFLMVAATVVAQQPAVDLAATVRQLHDAMIKPASEAIFNVGRGAPKNDEEWTAVSRAAVTLAESGNLLTAGSRGKDRRKWIALSRQLVAAGRTARRAAEARNVNALMEASDRVVIVCETCHARYRNQGPR